MTCMYQATRNFTTKVWLNVTRRLYLQLEAEEEDQLTIRTVKRL